MNLQSWIFLQIGDVYMEGIQWIDSLEICFFFKDSLLRDLQATSGIL